MTEAAQHLLSAIETVTKIERRNLLNFHELIRCQNLRSLAGLSSVNVPNKFGIMNYSDKVYTHNH